MEDQSERVKVKESGGNKVVFPEQKGFISAHRNTRGILMANNTSKNTHFSERDHSKQRQYKRQGGQRRTKRELRSDTLTIDMEEGDSPQHQQRRFTHVVPNNSNELNNMFYPSSQNYQESDIPVKQQARGSVITSQDEQVLFMVVNSEAEPGTYRKTVDSQTPVGGVGVSKIVEGSVENTSDLDFVSQADKSDLLVCLNQMKHQVQQRRSSTHNSQVSLAQHNQRNFLKSTKTRHQPTQIANSAIVAPIDSVSQRDESQGKYAHKVGRPSARLEYSNTGLSDKQMQTNNVRAQNLLGRGHCSLSISSINSNGVKDDNADQSQIQEQIEMPVARHEQRVQSDPYSPKKPAAMQTNNTLTLTIDYDETEFVTDTQEIIEDKCIPYDRPIQVNRVRGLTPQRRLLSSQKLIDASSTEISKTGVKATVGSEDPFGQSGIKLRKVEPKRSVSVSAKESAAELMLPYNRRAMLLRERKEQLKQQARENSFQRSQQKHDSVSRMIADTQSVATVSQQNFNLGKVNMFNSSNGGQLQQQTQMQYTRPNNVQSGKLHTNSLMQSDPLNLSSFDHGHLLSNSNYLNSVDGGQYHHQQPVIKHHSTQLQKQPPGNQQIGQSMVYKPRPLASIGDGESSNQSRIERAKQMINMKFQQMVDWGNFTSQHPEQQDFEQQMMQIVPDTNRTFGKQTQREINRNKDTRNVPGDLDQQKITFGMEQHNVFTPPATKQFKLAIDEQGKVVAATVRDGEGEIPMPNSKKSPLKSAIVKQSFSQMAQKNHQRVLLPSHSRNGLTIKQNAESTTGECMTLNPNGRHGVALTQDSGDTTVMPGLKQQSVNMYQRRLAAVSSAKSTKSLRDLLQVNKSMHRSSQSKPRAFSKQRSGRPPMTNSSMIAGLEANQGLYQSVHQIRSPKMAQSSFHTANQTQMKPQLMVPSDRVKQQEYPCSSFFQNDENFERSHRTEVAALAQQPGRNSSSPLKLFNQASEPALRVRSLLVQSANDSEIDHKFITTMQEAPIMGSTAGNVQGEEEGMVELVKNKESSPFKSHLERRQLQSASKQQFQDKSTPVHQISLTARKNFSSQHNNMTPMLANKLNFTSGTSAHQRSGAKLTNPSYHNQHMSPKFLVVKGQQQRENSTGRCSISSILNFQHIGDDLPPDPSMQTKTIDDERTIEEYPSRRNITTSVNTLRQTIQNKMLHLRQAEAPQQKQIKRHEIMAVAPKTNQMSMVGAQSEASQSILMTQSDVDVASTFQSQQPKNVKLQLATSMTSSNKKTLENIHKAQNYNNQRPIPVVSPEQFNLKRQFQASPPQATKQQQSIMNMVKVNEKDDEEEKVLSESEKLKKKREKSFIRNGYEIYVEGTYIVNGRKKKKIKKRKLSQAQLEQYATKLGQRASQARAAGNLTQAQSIEQEMQALGEIGQQTLQMSTAKNVVTIRQNQVQKMPFAKTGDDQIPKLLKQTASQQFIQSSNDGGKQSPRLHRPTPIGLAKKAEAAKSGVSNFGESLPLPPRTTVTNEKRKFVTKVKMSGTEKSGFQGVQQVPRSLFVKRSPRPKDLNSSEMSKEQPSLQDSEREERKGGESKQSISSEASNSQSLLFQNKSQMMSSQRSINLRDPELQLITSNRLLTLHDVSAQMLGGSQKFILHRMIFQKKFAELLKVFRSGFLTAEALNMRDHQGNTPLLLAAKMSANEEEYLRCINFLFKEGCDGKMRDGNGWSILDEAIGQANPRLLAIAFQWLNHRKKDKIKTNKTKVLDRLKKIPDFYCELHWECQSSWIPFLSKFAPSDNFQIWKVGSNIRLDFSLVGFKRMQNKRRRMSILFRNAAVDEADERYKHIDILMVNRDRQILTNPLEDLDDDEKLAVLTDMMNSDSVQSELNIVDQTWEPVQNFFGTTSAHERVNNYDCSRYKLQIQAQVKSKKKLNLRFQHTYDTYFEGAEEFQEGQKAVADPNSFKIAKDEERSIESQLWLSQEFPLQFTQFMEVLDTLAISGQASMQKINEFLSNDCLKDVINQNGFPVKIQVPIGLAIKAMVTFGNFQYLNPENREEYIKETFAVPDYCKLVSRKEGMKTLESKKKRLAVANVVI